MHARERGAVVLRGSCDEAHTGGAFDLFRQALDGYARELDEVTLRTVFGPQAPVLAALVPRLRERLSDLAEPVPLQPDEERTRLFDAVFQCLLAITRQAPVLLELDDLHWAAPDTVALLRYVVRAVPHEGTGCAELRVAIHPARPPGR